MKISAKIEAAEEEQSKYPYIGRYGNTFVLFCSDSCGTVISDALHNSSDEVVYEVGHYSEEWDEYGFTKFSGSITLTV